MALVEVFPILNGHFGLKILEYRITLLESFVELNICDGSFDVLKGLVKHQLSAIGLFHLLAEELLFL